jgi:hypothetical protein
MAEGWHRDIKRCSIVATLFPNEASALRLAITIHIEISEGRETSRSYITL